MELTTKALTDALRIIVSRLEGSDLSWAITGSLGFALQGIPVAINDIDIQTDRNGAYEIERLMHEFVQTNVTFSVSERIRSHFGSLLICGVTVEIMGDVERRLENNSWQATPDLKMLKRFVGFGDLLIPVFPLEYEYKAYHILGREQTARMLQKRLSARRANREKGREQV